MRYLANDAKGGNVWGNRKPFICVCVPCKSFVCSCFLSIVVVVVVVIVAVYLGGHGGFVLASLI